MSEEAKVLSLEAPDDSIQEKIEEVPVQIPVEANNDRRELIEDAIRANTIDNYVKKIEALLQKFPCKIQNKVN